MPGATTLKVPKTKQSSTNSLQDYNEVSLMYLYNRTQHMTVISSVFTSGEETAGESSVRRGG